MKKHIPVSILFCTVISLLLGGCQPKRSQSDAIRIRWGHDPETLDPMLLPNQQAIDANNLLNISLLQADASTQEFAPALAETLPSSQLEGDSLMRLGYKIKPSAAWDTGQPVLASDVEFTLKLMFCPGLPNEAIRSQYQFIRQILADAQDKRRFTLVCQGQALEYVKASGDFFILSEAALDPHQRLRRFALAALKARAVDAPPDSALQKVAQQYLTAVSGKVPGQLSGCGPYQLKQWEKDRYLTFQRKPHWWADQLRPTPFVLQAWPQQLTYVVIPDAATATLALQRGDLDIYPQIPAREFARLRASSAAKASLRFYTSPSHDVVTAGFNTRRPALADAPTRRALSQCFDAAGLLRATQLGNGQRSAGIISPSDRTNYNDSLPLVPFDPSATARLLRQAGWQQAAENGWFRNGPKGAQQLELTLRYRADESLFATVALQFQAAAATIGIPVKLQPTESGTFTTALHAGDFDMYVRVLKGNPFLFNFTPVLHSAGVGVGNSTGFSTPASDRLIEAIVAANTKAQRARLLRRFQELMQREEPLVPLFFLPNHLAANRNLTNLHVNSLKPGYVATAIKHEAAPSSTP